MSKLVRYTPKDLAEDLGIHVNTVRSWCRDGLVKTERKGKGWIIIIDDDQLNREINWSRLLGGDYEIGNDMKNRVRAERKEQNKRKEVAKLMDSLDYFALCEVIKFVDEYII